MSTSLPEPGDIVAERYVIERLLGRGGMGVVYVVTHMTTGKRLALKCLLPEYVQHPELVERFLREAQAAGRIEHRHIVDVFDAGRDGSILYMVMALLEGKSLTALLQDEALTLEETLGILVRAMDGVAAAHAEGIVHRDLKPDNIFVCVGPSGRLDDPRVLDFGISKLEDDATHSLTQSGVMMGTPYYMSFEQLNSQRDLDQRVDVYAMGVILYEALAGQVPYVAESAASLAIRMLTQPVTSLSVLRPDLPKGLADVVMKAIARDRDERHPSMRALIQDIRPFAPLGAGSLVVEGAGTPLRSSRLSELQALGTGPTETPMPRAEELRPTPPSERPRLELGAAPEGFSPRITARSRGGFSRMAMLSAAFIMLSLGVWLFVREILSARRAEPGSVDTPVAAGVGGAEIRPAAVQTPTQTSLPTAPQAAEVEPAASGTAKRTEGEQQVSGSTAAQGKAPDEIARSKAVDASAPAIAVDAATPNSKTVRAAEPEPNGTAVGVPTPAADAGEPKTKTEAPTE